MSDAPTPEWCDKPLARSQIEHFRRHPQTSLVHITSSQFRYLCELALSAQAAESRAEALRKASLFAGKVLEAHRGHLGDVDGGDLQQWALDCGLLETRTVTESCGPDCNCGLASDFPLECHFLSEAGKSAIDAAHSACGQSVS